MSIKIGHSSINELGKINGGISGNQNGCEVCFSKWYNGNWNYVLRPKTKELAEKSAKFVEDVCENKNVGYDQSGTGMTEGRNSLYQQAKRVNFDGSKISVPCESDCSSFMHTAAIAGGANITYGSNGYTTRTMVKAFERSGDYKVLTDKKYLTSDKYLKRGDILVREGSHTIMALENGSEVLKENKKTDEKVLYRVQIGAYSIKFNADNFLKKVKKSVPDAFITTVNGMYKIQVGAYSVKTNAEKQLKKMKELGYTDAFITVNT